MKTPNNLNSFNLPDLNDDQLKEIEALNRLNDNMIDLSSIPELTDDELNNGQFVFKNSSK